MAVNNRTQGAVNFIFDGTKQTRDLTSYALFRGVTDWANLYQFNQFETGYGLFIVLTIPRFLKELAHRSEQYAKLINTYVHILEYEFRGLDGIDNMQGETNELTNGVKQINIINKVTSQSGSNFSLRYFEKSGAIITKVHELFLRGVKTLQLQLNTTMVLSKMVQSKILDLNLKYSASYIS